MIESYYGFWGLAVWIIAAIVVLIIACLIRYRVERHIKMEVDE